MRKIENECVNCPPDIYCLGSVCPYRDVAHYYCDKCGKEEKLYHYDDEELCEDCLLKEFDVVEGSDDW